MVDCSQGSLEPYGSWPELFGSKKGTKRDVKQSRKKDFRLCHDRGGRYLRDAIRP